MIEISLELAQISFPRRHTVTHHVLGEMPQRTTRALDVATMHRASPPLLPPPLRPCHKLSGWERGRDACVPATLPSFTSHVFLSPLLALCSPWQSTAMDGRAGRAAVGAASSLPLRSSAETSFTSHAETLAKPAAPSGRGNVFMELAALLVSWLGESRLWLAGHWSHEGEANLQHAPAPLPRRRQRHPRPALQVPSCSVP